MARSRVDKRPQAIRDLADIAVYLAEESGSDDLAFRFLDAAEASFEQLIAMARMGLPGSAVIRNSKAYACGVSLASTIT